MFGLFLASLEHGLGASVHDLISTKLFSFILLSSELCHKFAQFFIHNMTLGIPGPSASNRNKV